ncbi:MAG: YlxR family protein [Aeromicrobium sp.]|uniref:YlxR family protein n=1 Tax=Aeromicrobium sp. TaxID=1871063 RepID=UPI003C665C06
MGTRLGETGRVGPVVRTCIGCRERADVTTLVRFVAVQGSTTTVVTPDLHRSLPGRGAHLHPTDRCLELATRRKAWGRAFRTVGSLDLEPVTRFIAAPTPLHDPNGSPTGGPRPESEHPLMENR